MVVNDSAIGIIAALCFCFFVWNWHIFCLMKVEFYTTSNWRFSYIDVRSKTCPFLFLTPYNSLNFTTFDGLYYSSYSNVRSVWQCHDQTDPVSLSLLINNGSVQVHSIDHFINFLLVLLNIFLVFYLRHI